MRLEPGAGLSSEGTLAALKVKGLDLYWKGLGKAVKSLHRQCGAWLPEVGNAISLPYKIISHPNCSCFLPSPTGKAYL